MDIVYIGGYSRSGSTLLMRLLSSRTSGAAVGELHEIWTRSFQDNQLCGCGTTFLQCPFWSDVVARSFDVPPTEDDVSHLERTRLAQQGAARPAGWRGLVRQLTASSDASGSRREYLQTLGRLYRSILTVSGSEYVLDSSKVPQYAWLLAQVPGVRLHMIHIVRDSRATAFSWQREKLRPEIHWRRETMRRQSLVRSALEWDVFNAMLRSRRGMYATYAQIKYEDLVAQPSDIVTGLVKRVGLTEMVSEGWQRPPWPHTAAGNPIRFEDKQGPIVLDRTWQTEMAPRARAAVTALTRAGLRRYGYLGVPGEQ